MGQRPLLPQLPHLLPPLSPNASVCPGATSRPHHPSLCALYPWSLRLVFQQRVITYLGQTKSASQEDFLANGGVLGKRHRFSLVRRYFMGSLLTSLCPLPFPTFVHTPHLSCPCFSPLSPCLLHTCPPPVHSYTVPLRFPPYSSSTSVFPPLLPHTCPPPHLPMVLPKFLKHLLDNQPGAGGGGSEDKNSSRLPQGIDVFPKMTCDCPPRPRSQCRPSLGDPTPPLMLH